MFEILYKLIAVLLNKAKRVHFVLDEGSFDFALDLVLHKGQPLFLQYPVSFSYVPVNANKQYRFNEFGRALVVRDETTDPESASLMMSKWLVNTQHHEMEDITKAGLKKRNRFDVALLSLHGIAGEGDAFMQLNDEQVFASDLQQLKGKLLYLDSCQMGSSYSFAAEFSNSKTEFIVAPLFDNEAGGSSTATIKSFFTQVNSGKTPADAMHITRKTLFKDYEKADNFTTAIWKACPFRMIQIR